jgi:hypothetical protein
MAQGTSQCGEIRFTDNGFIVKYTKHEWKRVCWADVEGIAAYKEDLFTIDRIVLAFKLVGAGEDYTVADAEMAGYGQLRAAVQRRYLNGDATWENDLWSPAFQCCWTPLWGDMPPVLECQRCTQDMRAQRTLVCPTCGHENDPRACDACRGTGRVSYAFEYRLGIGLIVAGLVACAGKLLFGVGAWLIALALIAYGGWCAAYGFRDAHGRPCRSCLGTGRRGGRVP